MSLAAETRAAVRERPVLYDALRAGIVNYTAAAESLDLDGETDAIATALRRFAQSLATEAADADATPTDSTDADGADAPTVRMRRGLDRVAAEELVVAVGGRGVRTADPAAESASTSAAGPIDPAGPTDRSASTRLTAIDARGTLEPSQLTAVLDRLRIADISVEAAGVDAGTLVVVVPQRAGVTALRIVESTLDSS